jgi:cyclophilin family peptidyl-prolyl cis-trans isomerase
MLKQKNLEAASKAAGIDITAEIKAFIATHPMPEDLKLDFNHPIDWERVLKLDPKQKVAIKTSKGEFIVQLNVTWCPGTCAAFTELIDRGFYKNLTIHRVVPNFVMQDGCPRGDGWGGPEFTIRSEFSPTPFMEGTLGMASAGKDTEGSQWYVTHSPTPHLDSKYANFGFVISGMDVVHKLEVGDTILGMELIR